MARDSVTMMLTFSDGETEAMYQNSLKEAVTWSSLGFSLVTVLCWILTFSKLLNTPHFASVVLPSALCAGLFNFLPSLLIVFLIAWKPAVFKSHWRLINVSLQLCQALCWNSFRALIFHQSLVPASAAHAPWPARPTPAPLHAFLNENVYLVLTWIRVLAFPTGLTSDVAIATATLGASLLGNAPFCRLQPGPALLVTQQEPFRSVAQRATSLLLAALALVGGVWWTFAPLPSSCSALLAFWQLLGWWLACVTVLLHEVVCRAAFIRARVGSPGPGAIEPSHGGTSGTLVTARPAAVQWRVLPASLYAFCVLLGAVLFFEEN